MTKGHAWFDFEDYTVIHFYIIISRSLKFMYNKFMNTLNKFARLMIAKKKCENIQYVDINL